MIHPSAIVDNSAQIASDVEIGPYSIIREHVSIGSGTVIGPHAVIDSFVTIGRNCRVFQFASVGAIPQDLKYSGEVTYVEIGDNTDIREFVTINRGTAGGGGITKIGSGCLLMAYSHVAHDCIIGDHVVLANAATLAGHVSLGDYAFIGGLTAIQQFVRIGAHTYIGGHCGVRNDIPPYTKAAGEEKVKLAGINTIGMGRRGFSEETIIAVKTAYRMLFRSKQTIKVAIGQIRSELPPLPEIIHLIDFIESSKIGITR